MKKNLKQILSSLAEVNDGVLTPEAVVDFARPKTSPLHSRFDWSDTSAARKYRIWQARQLISVVVNYYEPKKGERLSVRAFVSLTGDRRDGGYRDVNVVMADKDMRKQALADALNELALFKAKYAALTELAMVFAAIRKVKQ